VQLLQGLGRRPTGTLAHGVSDRPGAERGRHIERCRRAGAHAIFFPSPQTYEIIHRNLYVTHQRVAETFHKHRVLLAGDAAHVNNPIGGMGLNGGIQDAANLSDKLVRIMRHGAPPERLLNLYDLQRRTVAIEFVQEQSIANKKRLEARDPAVRARNLDELRASAADPERARQFLLRTSMIASQRRAMALAG
jgi:3-(3-hydroxy-phenyl)propionate hydroxylase